MMNLSHEDPIPGTFLDQVSTYWNRVHDPAYFVTSYAPGIVRYLEALLKDRHDAEEVAQDFFLRVHQQGLRNATPERGRFRDYLKKAVRNAALNFLRSKHATHRTALPLKPEALSDAAELSTDQRWLAGWREALLDHVWKALKDHEGRAPGNLCHTVLRLTVDHPEADSLTLAALASARAGRLIRPDAFRKQLSRARRLFAELLFQEVARTLRRPTAEHIREELIELGLMEYVRPYLPGSE
jgi:RNA polymerase sigma factor (sigma-70 family)